MGSKEDVGKGCPAAGGVSSFTIQSILGGGPSEAPREPAGWPARKRSLSVSSEEEEPEEGEPLIHFHSAFLPLAGLARARDFGPVSPTASRSPAA